MLNHEYKRIHYTWLGPMDKHLVAAKKKTPDVP